MKQFINDQAVVIGGDERQITVGLSLTPLFKKVKIFGPPLSAVPAELEATSSLEEALTDIKFVILPISGMNDAGMVRGYQPPETIDFGSHFQTLPKETIIVAGSMTSKWIGKAGALKLTVLQYAEDDELAVLNSIPTAEGAVQIAMEELPITIHGSAVMVVGFGRVGITVARTFKALGANVYVAARRRAVLARAIEMGCQTLLVDEISDFASGLDIIINTVPALVITKDILNKMNPEALIIDLASAPGGVDFETAKQLNIKAKLPLGIPGIVAPKTSGLILARIIPNLICRFIEDGGVINAFLGY